MRLEDEIQQKHFQSEYHKLLVNLIYSGNWVKAMNAEVLKPFGLTMQQYNVLRILKGQYPKPASVNLLIERMLDKMSNASRLVEKLRVKGLVERRENDSDRRQADVIITSEGLALLIEISKPMGKFEARSGIITEAEAKKVNDILDKMRG